MNNIRKTFNELTNSCDKLDHYFPLYEKHFSKFVGKSPKILEIGVQYGGSAELWYKYFGAGTEITGIDIDPKAKETDYLKIIVGDQGSEIFWNNFTEKYNNFDIIIDDGSHDNPHQILTLIKTYNSLKDGGVFWCEDVHTSYYYNVRKIRDGGYLNKNSFIEYSKNLIDVINSNHTNVYVGTGNDLIPFDGAKIDSKLLQLYNSIQGIYFYDSIVVIDKGPRFVFNRSISK
jgi:SAM-dependent methyltransferase